MIAGSTKRLAAYKNQIPGVLYECLLKMTEFDFSSHPDGKYDIGGYIMSVETTMTEPAAQRKLEGHKKYADVVYEIDVPYEGIGVVPALLAGEANESYPDRDLYFFPFRDEEKESLLSLSTGDFAICFPEDLHRPLCTGKGGSLRIRKAVLKVPVCDV